MWDEHQAYEELLYWDSLIQQGHRLLPEHFDRYEELRYWYDCLCYEEELRQYNDYIAAIEDIEDRRHVEEPIAPQKHSGPLDRMVMAKHAEVYPSAEDLEAVQKIISHVECALKTVSDEIDAPKDGSETTEELRSDDSKERVLRGVMRVGLVAKGLILKEDKALELVLLCSNKPTVTLLKQVVEKLTEQLEGISAGTYAVSHHEEDAAIVVKSCMEPALTLTIHLTSPLVRTEQMNKSAEEEGAYVGLVRSAYKPALCVLGMQSLCCSTDLKTRHTANLQSWNSTGHGLQQFSRKSFPIIHFQNQSTWSALLETHPLWDLLLLCHYSQYLFYFCIFFYQILGLLMF